jgi:hypothetical protein
MRIILKGFCVLIVLAVVLLVALGVHARAQEAPPRNPLAHDIFKQLIEINTTDGLEM